MHYHHQFGVLVPFAKKHFRVLVLAIAGIFIFSQFLWLLQPTEAATASVSTEAELVAALADSNNDTINIDSSFSTTAEIVIDRAVVINGNGHTISPTFVFVSNADSNSVLEIIGTDSVTINNLIIEGTGGTSIHGVNIYEATNVVLNRLASLNNDKSGIVVNSSTVTVDDVTTGGNAWHGINVDVKTALPSVLTVNGVSIHTDIAHIYSDHYLSGDVTVNDTENQYAIFDNPPDPNNYDDDRLYQLDPERFVYIQGQNEKIDICHAKNENAGGYTSNSISVNGLEGHGDHDNDIIPPNPSLPNGLNWTRDNVDIWSDGCGEDDGEVGGDIDVCDPSSAWATSVLANNQGNTKGGGAVLIARTNPNNALNAPDSSFYSLGVEGHLDVGFSGVVLDGAGADITVHEVTNLTNPIYPVEAADVYVSQNGTDWLLAGQATNNGGTGGISNIDFEATGLDWIQYVRLSEASNFNLHNNDADGFDVNAIGANFVCEAPEPCEEGETLVLVQTDNGYQFVCEEPVEPCVVSVVSDITNFVEQKEANAQDLNSANNPHPAWTDEATMSPAIWIWGDNPVVDPTQDETQTFVKTFDWSGPVDSAVIDIATDNRHEVWLNGNLVGSDASDNNFQPGTQDNYDLSAYIVQGVNTLEIVVTNLGVPGSDSSGNPAGLLYKAVITGPDQDCGEPTEITECRVLVSDITNTVDGTDDPAMEVTFIHDTWDANIDAATWIWGDDPVADPIGDTFQTFKKQFNWNGPAVSAVLEIAADNSYKVWLNGVEVAADANENNHGSHDTHSIEAEVVNGVNTLEIEVHNWAQAGGTTESNPAGLLYKLTVEGEEGCDEPEDQEEIRGSIAGTIYNDINQNQAFDPGDENPLIGVSVWLLTHNSPWFIHSISSSDANGDYLFEDLAVPGTYYVCQDVQDGWFQTQLNLAGLGGIEIGALGEGDQLGGDPDPELDALIDEFCWEVELSELSPTATDRDLGSTPNVLGEQDPGDGGEDGDVLAEEDGEVLAETGSPAVLAIVAGLSLLLGAVALTRATKKQ